MVLGDGNMSIATNLLLLMLGINIILFAFGEPEANSPMFAVMKAIFSGGDFDWSHLLQSIGSNAAVYILLIGLVSVASFLTGGNPLTSGGGHGALVALQVITIAIFSSLFLVPNFSTMGFPEDVLLIINIIFGSMYVVAMMSLLGGRD